MNEIQFYYTPQDIKFNASLVDKDNHKTQREIYGGMVTDDENLDLQRNFQTNIKLHETFNFRYTVDMKNNLNEYLVSDKNLNIVILGKKNDNFKAHCSRFQLVLFHISPFQFVSGT